jgi:hypothetical protein
MRDAVSFDIGLADTHFCSLLTSPYYSPDERFLHFFFRCGCTVLTRHVCGVPELHPHIVDQDWCATHARANDAEDT